MVSRDLDTCEPTVTAQDTKLSLPQLFLESLQVGSDYGLHVCIGHCGHSSLVFHDLGKDLAAQRQWNTWNF